MRSILAGVSIFQARTEGMQLREKLREMDALAKRNEKQPICETPAFTSEVAAESLHDNFFLLDRVGNFIYISPALAEILEISPNWLIGKNVSDLLRQDKQEHFLALRERLLSGEALQIEWEIPRDSADSLYLRIFLAPWRRGEEVVGVVGAAWDITEAVLGERELEKKALLLRLQMDVLERLGKADGVTEMLRVIVDKACEALGMEAGCMASLYNSERGWLIRQIIQTRWPLSAAKVALWRELPGREVAKAMENMQIFSLREGEGPQEWMELQNYKSTLVVPILSSSRGGFALILASMNGREWRSLERDFLQGLVSIAGQALRRAELVGSLRQSEEIYVNLADSVSEAIAIIESEKVIFANQTMSNLMGFTKPSEMVGTMLGDFVFLDSLEDLRVRAKEDDYVPGKMRLRLKRHQGQEFVTNVEITRLPYGNKRVFQVMIKGEGEAGPQDALSQIEFMSRLSHDFRTPLVSVSGFADILDRFLEPEKDSKEEECLGGIKRGVMRLNRIVDNMLTLSRVQPAHEEKWADSSQVLREVLEDFTESIRNGRIDVVIPDGLPSVPISEGDLQEVFQNLLSNAFRAVRGVENPRITVGYEFFKEHHFFSIGDNGVGIPEEHHESVFKPLFRLVSGDEGSGLGLSIVRQILRARSGDVWLTSTPGTGSTFHFSIPAA
jgi:PAS domain S-box-containing protein